MLAHPILINRPMVVTPRGTRLRRPPELVLNLLDPRRSFVKEEGEIVTPETLKQSAHFAQHRPSFAACDCAA
jgi:hypothetical protein